MIWESDVDISAPALRTTVKASTAKISSTYRWIIVCLVLTGAVIGLQLASGAYSSEFSAYPDEPAHYVTSLMVCDYVKHFQLISPMRFAQTYYDHYPKVALGHWPPVFYFVQAAWMLLAGASRESIRVEIALTTVLLALSLYSELRRRFEWRMSLLGSLLCIALPLMQTYSSEEMAESMLTLFCFWSAVHFARYAERLQTKDALLFALYFSLAVLTKGNGWLIAMIPLIVVSLTRRVGILFRPALWVSAIIVAAACLPWQMMTMQMAEQGWEGGSKPSVAYTIDAAGEFLTLFLKILGPFLLAVMLIGLYRAIVNPLRKGKPVGALDSSLFALIVAAWAFHSLVPAGVEDRKLIIAVPAMIYFVVLGTSELARLVPFSPRLANAAGPITMAAVLVPFTLQTFHVPHVDHYGFDSAAQFIASDPRYVGERILVSSQSVGEGLIVSELAMLRPDPQNEVVRATKSMATVAWNGKDYRCRFHNADEAAKFLQQSNIDLIVLDKFPAQINYLHDRLLKEVMANSTAYRLAGRFPSRSARVSGGIEIYERRRDLQAGVEVR